MPAIIDRCVLDDVQPKPMLVYYFDAALYRVSC
jgi:hypothetical protein